MSCSCGFRGRIHHHVYYYYYCHLFGFTVRKQALRLFVLYIHLSLAISAPLFFLIYSCVVVSLKLFSPYMSRALTSSWYLTLEQSLKFSSFFPPFATLSNQVFFCLAGVWTPPALANLYYTYAARERPDHCMTSFQWTRSRRA